MNETLGLKTLATVMGWDDDTRVYDEWEWLRLISRFKYDGYSDFIAGARFIENLVIWLQQFDKGGDRNAAYDYIKKSLIYISTSEMHKLVSLFYYRVAEPTIISKVCEKLNIPEYEIWLHDDAVNEFKILRRRSLFMGLSDGARIDVLRYSTHGMLIHEQMVNHVQPDNDKWRIQL